MTEKKQIIYVNIEDRLQTKTELKKIAKKNKMTLNQLMNHIINKFLNERKAGKNFHIKLE